MKHTKKRVAALLLTLAMVLSLMPMAFADDAAGFPDMPAEDEASYAAVKSAVDNELLKGEDGMLNLEDPITRATMAALVTRVFGAKGEADLSAYPDVDGHWAVTSGELPAAVAMGIMSGSNGMMRPNDQVTMQEVITMLVRALGLKVDPNATLEGVEGADSVAAWAVPYVAALVKVGYISDVTGAAEPMSRVEFAEMIYKVSGEGNYVKESAEITEDAEGNIIITADGVTLKGITVKGDVIIADGVDAGSIVLDNVKIDGRLVVRGGAEASLTNGTTASETVVAKTTGEVTVKADASSKAGDIAVAGTDNGTDIKIADKVVIDMAEPSVTVTAATELAVQNAEGGSVTLQANGASLSVESGTLENVTVADNASDVKIDVAEGATIEMVSSNEDITITGEGTVEEKEGSGTVTDAEGNEVAGSDEPVDVPAVTPPSTPTETDPNAPTNATHEHNWAATAVNFDATRHTFTCVNRDADLENGITAVIGCGAKTYAAHSYGEDGTCTATGCDAAKSTTTTGDVTGEGDDDDACKDHVWDAGEKQDYAEGKTVCTADTVIVYTCTNEGCSATYSVTTTPKGHSYKATGSVAASCDESGSISYKCTTCDDIKSETIPATGNHNWKLTSQTAGDCNTAAVMTYTCTTCTDGSPETRDVNGAKNPSAHDWNTEWAKDTTDHWHACKNGCESKGSKAAHTYADGTCSVCGAKESGSGETQPKEKHTCTFGEWVKQSDGSYKATCTITNDGKDHEAATNGVKTHTHNYVWNNQKGSNGSHGTACANCPITGEATGTAPCTDAQANEADGTEGKGVCDVCGGDMPTG